MSDQQQTTEIWWRLSPYGYLGGKISDEQIAAVLARLAEENIPVEHRLSNAPPLDPITQEEAGFDDFTHIFVVPKDKTRKVRSVLRKLLPNNKIDDFQPRPFHPEPAYPSTESAPVEIDRSKLRTELREAFPDAEVHSELWGSQWRVWIEQGSQRVELDWGRVWGFRATERRKKRIKQTTHVLNSIEEAIALVSRVLPQTST